jgi:hypothetical protein
LPMSPWGLSGSSQPAKVARASANLLAGQGEDEEVPVGDPAGSGGASSRSR